jgi:hypothetical protein
MTNQPASRRDRGASLFQELKRRHVIRVGVLYLVTSWGLLQVASLIFDVLDVGKSSMRLPLMLLVLGFPVAIALAWFYAVTPSGVRREDDLDRSETGRRMRAGGSTG